MEFGIYTFGDLAVGDVNPARAHQRLSEIVAAAKIADAAGIDVFGVGEHHRMDLVVSVPSAVLGGDCERHTAYSSDQRRQYP